MIAISIKIKNSKPTKQTANYKLFKAIRQAAARWGVLALNIF